MKKLIALLLAAAIVLTLTACGETAEPTEVSTDPAKTAAPVSYTYEFDGMMGKETAQIDLNPDHTCRFWLPGNEVIKDIYEGIYNQEGNTVTIFGLKNVDKTSAYALPGLWDWIVEGNATITVSGDGTFVPVGGGESSNEAPAETGGLKNVAYATTSGAQVCDIHVPENADNCPVIILVHGGGFMFGDQSMDVILPVIDKALEKGYAVVSVDYRKAMEAVFPAAVGDVKAAVRFVKANAVQYGFDPDKIVIWGESAGAYLSLMTALTPGVEALDADVTDYAEISSDVTALVSFYAPVEFYTLYEEAGKPDSAANSFESKFLGQDITADKNATYETYWETYTDTVPADLKVWIQVGNADKKVPYTQSVNFADRLKNYIPEENIAYSIIEGADHEDDLFYTDENLDAIFAWLDSFIK